VTGTNPPAAVLYLSDGRTFSSTLFLDSDLGRASKPWQPGYFSERDTAVAPWAQPSPTVRLVMAWWAPMQSRAESAVASLDDERKSLGVARFNLRNQRKPLPQQCLR